MRTVNTDNPRNIKCEHCKYWGGIDTGNHWGNYKDCIGCVNPDSPKYAKITMYYNRCKQFEWREKYTR